MFVDIPTATITDTPTDTPTDSPAALYTPASPQPCTAEQTVCVNMGGGKTQAETATTASQITFQAVMLPWNGDALTQPRESFKLMFLTIPLFRLSIPDSREGQTVLMSNVGCPLAAGERHDPGLQVKKHSLYFLLFLMMKTI